MNETPYFFPSGPRALFGVYHAPAEPSAKPAFVFCHPFAEEKLWTHRVFVEFARSLARKGHPVLRFDYMGNGDSEGAFAESSLTTMLADVRCAVAEAQHRSGAPGVNLLGLRLGATIAALAAETIPGIGRLALWAPITDGARYMQDMLRVNLTTQMATYKELRHDREALVEQMKAGHTANVDGYEMAYPLYAEVSAVALAAEPKRYAGPVLVVHVDRQTERPAADLQKLCACYAGATLGAANEEPFWKEIARSYQQPARNLFDVTETWLEQPMP